MRIFLIVFFLITFTAGSLLASPKANLSSSSLFSKAKIIKNNGDTNIDIRYRETSNLTVDSFFETYRSEFNWQNDNTAAAFKITTDELGITHHRFKQYFKGIELADVQFLIHEKNGLVKHAHGDLIHDLDIDVNPTISSEEALLYATRKIGAEKYMWESARNEAFIKNEQGDETATFYPKGQLMISARNHDFNSDNFRLVYRFDIYAQKPLGRYNVDVDAQTGDIVNVISTMMEGGDVNGQGTSVYNGVVPLVVADTVISSSTTSFWHINSWNAFDTDASWWVADPEFGDNGGYDNNWYEVLDTDPVVLNGDDVKLEFFHRYKVEVPGGEPAGYNGWDGMNVRISVDGGESWEILSNPQPAYTVSSLYSFGFIHGEGEGIPGWTNEQQQWSKVTIDLSGYTGQTAQIRFTFASDGGFSTNDGGPEFFSWQLDDVIVSNSSEILFSNSGEDTGVTAQSLIKEVSVIDGNYRLRQYGKGGGIFTYDAVNGTSLTESVDFVNTDNDFSDANHRAGVSVHWAASATYDYFAANHGMNSFDNKGKRIISYVHYDNEWFNATMDGTRMRFGDGTANNNPLVSIDIVAHEYSHGVTQFSANLIYESEYGALNESFSDIFGNSVEFNTEGAIADWGVGVGAVQLRSMSDPNSFGDPDTYEGENWVDPENIANDGGGVHTNSNVQNYWYYLLCEGGSGTNDHGREYSVSAIGMEDAAKIAFRNLTTYLMPTSEYDAARIGSIYAAEDLFGKDSDQYLAVIDAWNAVGVERPYFTATIGVDSDSVSFFAEASAGEDMKDVYIFNYGLDSLQINSVDLTGANFELENLAELPVKLGYAEALILSVKFIPTEKGLVTGEINISSNDVSTPVKTVSLNGEGWKITPPSEGIIYSVISKSNDGSLVTLDQDNGTGVEVGFTGFGMVRGAALKPSTNEIFATVFSGASTPVLRIDAESGLAIQTYDLDSTNIRAIAFDANDDLYGANYSTGELFLISLESGEFTLIGDTELALVASLTINPLTGDLWAAASNTKVYILNKNTAEATLVGDTGFPKTIAIEFDQEGKLFGISGFASNKASDLIKINTETGEGKLIGSTGMKLVTGMVISGNVIVGVDEFTTSITPDIYKLHQNYPNPFNPATNIQYDIPEASFVSLKIYNMLGQEVRTLVNNFSDAGFKTAIWDGRDNAGKYVSSGIYIYSLKASDFTQSIKMLLLR